mmetsp:Transcript_16026/g.20949  ORF Transcript_16026/g.20949 Transcript_16026/m.20949 type:complete len:161 (-) Transcript_16026:1346-1828(-)
MSEDSHGEPYDGMMCLCTMEDISMADGNYVEYQCFPSMRWKPSLYEKAVVDKLLNEQFTTFVARVKKTDCQAELRRLLTAGPPIWLEDKHAMPLVDEGDTHIVKLWFAENNEEISAKLHGAVEGEDRDKLWEELREFLIEEGKEEGDEDAGNGDSEKTTS